MATESQLWQIFCNFPNHHYDGTPIATKARYREFHPYSGKVDGHQPYERSSSVSSSLDGEVNDLTDYRGSDDPSHPPSIRGIVELPLVQGDDLGDEPSGV
ncbi:hypothetical protein HAX54_008837 [Datura stramonium]|uniref:Uncharacterized protein n=1 Tax=Datura stramonium TaxID=4076 RepID=A0ABS8TE04_DATST|nr:hypothetical protein [Datura stramonium]